MDAILLNNKPECKCGDLNMKEKLLAAFYEMIPEAKRELFDKIATDRTRGY